MHWNVVCVFTDMIALGLLFYSFAFFLLRYGGVYCACLLYPYIQHHKECHNKLYNPFRIDMSTFKWCIFQQKLEWLKARIAKPYKGKFQMESLFCLRNDVCTWLMLANCSNNKVRKTNLVLLMMPASLLYLWELTLFTTKMCLQVGCKMGFCAQVFWIQLVGIRMEHAFSYSLPLQTVV